MVESGANNSVDISLIVDRLEEEGKGQNPKTLLYSRKLDDRENLP